MLRIYINGGLAASVIDSSEARAHWKLKQLLDPGRHYAFIGV